MEQNQQNPEEETAKQQEENEVDMRSRINHILQGFLKQPKTPCDSSDDERELKRRKTRALIKLVMHDGHADNLTTDEMSRIEGKSSGKF